jgi:hypothetical protein
MVFIETGGDEPFGTGILLIELLFALTGSPAVRWRTIAYTSRG